MGTQLNFLPLESGMARANIIIASMKVHKVSGTRMTMPTKQNIVKKMPMIPRQSWIAAMLVDPM